MRHVKRDLFANEAPQQHGQIAQRFANIENLRAQCLLARKCQQMPHQTRRPVGVLLDLHDVAERWVGWLMRVEQEVGRHHDSGKHVVEIMRDAAGELADQLHLLLLGYLVFQFALRGRFQRIDNCGFLIALFLLDRGDVESAEALALAGQHGIDRRDVGLPERRLPDCGLQRFAIARGDGGNDGAVLCFAAGVVEQPRE
jgi:hypothetical protein